MFTQKRNSYLAEAKLESETENQNTSRKNKERKLGFLHLELQDIRNNKGNVTLQVRSIEHLQTWLKRDSRLQSSLLIQPISVSVEELEKSKDMTEPTWWKSFKQEANLDTAWRKPTDFKQDSR